MVWLLSRVDCSIHVDTYVCPDMVESQYPHSFRILKKYNSNTYFAATQHCPQAFCFACFHFVFEMGMCEELVSRQRLSCSRRQSECSPFRELEKMPDGGAQLTTAQTRDKKHNPLKFQWSSSRHHTVDLNSI